MGPTPYEEPLTQRPPPGAAGCEPEAQGEKWVGLWVGGPIIAGALLGLVLPASGGASSEPQPWRLLSEVLGWSYFVAWSVSFYPQVVWNFRRRSVVGLSLDFQLLNLGGFSCYFAFNAALYYNSTVQQEYRDKHDGSNSAVQLNDVFFAGHAAVLTAITLVQIAMFYDYPPLDKSDKLLRYAVVTFLVVLVAGTTGVVAAISATGERSLSWLTFFSLLAEVKVGISVVKYCPQVWMNYRRKSTHGWSIVNVLLDFSGGLLSILQLLIDALAMRDWSAVTGDPAKFLLGNLSMFFDVIFLTQHYCVYPRRAAVGRSVGP